MDKLYTIQEVATKLGLSDKTLRRWEEAGRFTPSRTLGNQRRYTLEDLQVLDAIKHGTINEQKDLLTIVQAAALCGVSPTTIVRWEDGGKIHPLITSGNTYYPRQKLMEKMEELKNIYVEPIPDLVSPGSDLEGRAQPRIYQSGEGQTLQETKPLIPYSSYFIHALITLLLILTYHLVFNQALPPVSPQVQGASTSAEDPRLDDLILKFQNHLSSEMLDKSKPTPVTTINLDGTSLITGTITLPKTKDQLIVTNEKILTTTPVTATFTSDYAPAKKYWITVNPGSFTLHTDFPVSSDSTLNYSFLAPESTASASPKPSIAPAIIR